VDNSRILLAATEVVKAGGLGDDISDLPAAGSAPEWMSEKAISIGHYFVASGVYTVFGVTLPVIRCTGIPENTCTRNLKKCMAACGIWKSIRFKHAQKDDRSHRQETPGTGHRQVQSSEFLWTWPLAGTSTPLNHYKRGLARAKASRPLPGNVK
jgi:hypothetical protein